jgi:ATP-dependent RNA helicase SUPV3L1/SUV3
MGALSPQTRNAQVAMYQSGEVDYLVATDAIGMGLNLDVGHVAFAGLSKFDGVRQRRLTPAEMAQIAGRAGRHQRDGTFGTLAGTGGHDSEFTPEEIYAIEEHRFAPLPRLFWREAEPRFDSLRTLIADLETPPLRPELAPAPEAIDLAVLKRLAEEGDVVASVRGTAQVRRFWEVCRLPDFRHQGAETHARFVARLWQDLARGQLGADYVAQAIAGLDHVSGDIDTLQGRIAAVRSWAYITQRPDWVLARDEMAARARAVEARLSDALHARLTERFVNRRTTVLMRKLGADAGLLPVRLEGDEVLVDGEPLGHLRGFRFEVDPQTRHSDRKLLLAAADKHLPAVLAQRAQSLAADPAGLALEDGGVLWNGQVVARLTRGRGVLTPSLVLDPALEAIPAAERKALAAALSAWLERVLAPLNPLRKLDAASSALAGGPELRALLIRLVDAGGMLDRASSGVSELAREQRDRLRALGVRIGALDLFVPAMLRPAPLALWRELTILAGLSPPPSLTAMPPVVPLAHQAPAGYRKLGKQAVRIDLAEKLLLEAHAARTARGARSVVLDQALARSMGLTAESHTQLLRLAGFQPSVPRPLAEGAFGPTRPTTWRWRPLRRQAQAPAAASPRRQGAFAALAELVG